MVSLIRTLLSDLYTTRSRHFRQGNLWVQLYPRMKTFLLVPRRASNHRRTTSWGVLIDQGRCPVGLCCLWNHRRTTSWGVLIDQVRCPVGLCCLWNHRRTTSWGVLIDQVRCPVGLCCLWNHQRTTSWGVLIDQVRCPVGLCCLPCNQPRNTVNQILKCTGSCLSFQIFVLH